MLLKRREAVGEDAYHYCWLQTQASFCISFHFYRKKLQYVTVPVAVQLQQWTMYLEPINQNFRSCSQPFGESFVAIGSIGAWSCRHAAMVERCFLVFLGGRNQPSGATLKVQLQPSSVLLRDISIPMVSVHDCSLMYEDVVDENDSSSKGGSSKQKFQARKTICNIEHTCITYWCNVHADILRWCVWVSVSNLSNDIKMIKWFGVWKGCGLAIELTSLWNGRKLLQSCRCWKPLCPGRGKKYAQRFVCHSIPETLKS